MTRPDWCPQDVWEVAVKMQDELYHWTDDPDPQEQDTLSFARAILAERERCAKACDEEIELARQFGPHHVPIISSIRRKIVEPA